MTYKAILRCRIWLLTVFKWSRALRSSRIVQWISCNCQTDHLDCFCYARWMRSSCKAQIPLLHYFVFIFIFIRHSETMRAGLLQENPAIQCSHLTTNHVFMLNNPDAMLRKESSHLSRMWLVFTCWWQRNRYKTWNVVQIDQLVARLPFRIESN